MFDFGSWDWRKNWSESLNHWDMLIYCGQVGCYFSCSHTSLPFPTDDHKFSEATAVLFTWIDRGEVNRRTANHFYSMIQSTNSHVRRLMSEKAQHDEEMERAKEIFKNALLAILTQCKETSLFLTHTVTLTELCRQTELTWEKSFR